MFAIIFAIITETSQNLFEYQVSHFIKLLRSELMSGDYFEDFIEGLSAS